MTELIELLRSTGHSLVLRTFEGSVSTYQQAGVRDLKELLRDHPALLRGASIADKVIGKAAAGFMVVGGVAQVHALVMSRQALPVLDAAGIKYTYDMLVPHIQPPLDGSRCPLEQIVAHCSTAQEIVDTLYAHWIR